MNLTSFFKIKIILTFSLGLMLCTTDIHAQPEKKHIQVKFLARKIPSMSFFNYDSACVQVFHRFRNSKPDSVVNEEIYLSAGQVLRYSMMHDGRTAVKSFIVPSSNDTIKFEFDDNYNLHIKGGINYFIEDAIDILYLDPEEKQISKVFLDNANGRKTISSIFKSNNAAISDLFNKGLSSKIECDVLLTIAKSDYYTRLMAWAKENKKYAEIETEMVILAKEKEVIQSVSSSSLLQVFSRYIGYVIYKDRLDTKNVITMVNAVINAGWHKNITIEYIASVLSGTNGMETTVATKCYEILQNYLNGEYESKLPEIAKFILPKLVQTDKTLLLTQEGKQLTFKELLKINSNKFLLIDFWASWCLPCRKQAPFFEAAKSDFLDKNIVFVSISLDEDDKVNDWKKALKDDGFLKATNHYKLMMPERSPMLEKFGIAQIPRYILINSDGEFVHRDFYLPSDPKFKEALSKIIASGN